MFQGSSLGIGSKQLAARFHFVVVLLLVGNLLIQERCIELCVWHDVVGPKTGIDFYFLTKRTVKFFSNQLSLSQLLVGWCLKALNLITLQINTKRSVWSNPANGNLASWKELLKQGSWCLARRAASFSKAERSNKICKRIPTKSGCWMEDGI